MNTAQGYVLIVEDDPDILKLLETTLTLNGYRVLTARNGFEGLAAIQKARPELVIADIMMPKLDGFGLVNRLRRDPTTRDVPVVVMTATYISPEDKAFAQKTGATLFIQKPIDLEKFLETVRELLKQGASVVREPLKDFEFYDEYRRRLEAKLDQKDAQIARAELLLNGTLPDPERHAIEASLKQAIHDREELRLLLKQTHEQLKRY